MKITSRSLLLALTITSVAKAATVEEWITAGDAAIAGFNLDKASLAYKRALKLDSKNYEACWRLGRATVDRGMLEPDSSKKRLLFLEAQDYARGAVRLNPKGSKGHAYLAAVVGQLALYEGGRTKVELSKEVKTESEKAIALDPKEDLSYHVLGVWNREMVGLNWFLRKFAEALYGSLPPASMDNALENLRHAVELAPTVLPHQVELGKTLIVAGKKDEGRNILEHTLAMPKTWVTDDIYKQKAREALR